VRATVEVSIGESNTMRFVIVAGIVLAAGAVLGSGRAQAQHYGGGYAEVVRCESRDYRQHYCDIETRGGVDIVNQLSDTACVEGRTWGWDRRGVWVSGGCRAEFASGGRGGYSSGPVYGGSPSVGAGGGYADIVRCESRDFNQIYCAAETRRGVRLVNQLSSTACIEGQTWGADRRGVWVRGGCRGEFEIGRGGSGGGYGYDGGRPGYGGGVPNSIVCESRDNRYRHCSINVRRDAELVRQLSDNHCVFNRSWGYDRNGVWVDRGCRGEFVVR
jgi:hypothetical protein